MYHQPRAKVKRLVNRVSTPKQIRVQCGSFLFAAYPFKDWDEVLEITSSGYNAHRIKGNLYLFALGPKHQWMRGLA